MSSFTLTSGRSDGSLNICILFLLIYVISKNKDGCDV